MSTVKVVTGTGSSGTTFFIQFLAKLGLTHLTGPYNEKVKGGNEWLITECGDLAIKHTPKIFKDPRLFFGGFENASNRLDQENIKIDFVWLCYRNFSIASESRIKRGVSFSSFGEMRGIGSDEYAKHIDFFRKGLESTIEYLCKNDISFMLVDYERLGDVEYCAQCLRFAGYNMPPMLIEECHKATYKSEYKERYKGL